MGTGHAEQHVTVLTDALLCLQLGGHELMAYIFHITDAGKWHLLLHIVAEPIATDGIAEVRWNNCAEEQTAIEHRLNGEAATHGKRHSPVGFDFTHARLIIKLGQVVGQIGIFGTEASATGREIPVVLTIVVHACMVAVEMLILEDRLNGCLRTELVAIVHIVPAEPVLDIEMTQIVVDGYDLCLELVVSDVIVALAFKIDIHVVAAEGIGEGRTGDTVRMNGQLAAGHQSLA